MSQKYESKTCLACGNTLKGRTDKKFCTDFCRNGYNNKLKSSGNNLIRNINNALKKNRRILESFLGEKEDTKKIKKEKLLQLGFQFQVITSIYTTQKGTNYFFCYEYGYIPLENDWYLIVRKKQGVHSGQV
jgi:hypothetical protein